jgi:hypothetical protein
VLAALRLDAGRLRVPRADGDREALRILLVARQEIRAPPPPRPAGCVRCCPCTRAYVARRTAEGKTPRVTRRCLKRYIARELYTFPRVTGLIA